MYSVNIMLKMEYQEKNMIGRIINCTLYKVSCVKARHHGIDPVQKNILGYVQTVHLTAVFSPRSHNGLQFLIFLIDLHKALHIGNQLGICQLLLQRSVLRLEVFQFLQ